MKKMVCIAAFAAAAACSQTKQADKSPQSSAAVQKQAKEETGPQKDLVCGMTIDAKAAEAKYVYKGKTYYFCSKEDQQEFAKDPAKFVNPKK